MIMEYNPPAILPPRVSDKRLVLASNSPRRRELLALITPQFSIAESRDVDESYPADTPAAQVPVLISQKKARAYADYIQPDEILITADTVVIADDKILGKPHSIAEAHDMLHLLSGRQHTVITGVTLTSEDKSDSFSAVTTVQFAPLTDEEIELYVTNYRPFDKAGSYGIQEWLGCIAISSISGSFYNVMGLPLHLLYTHLKSF